MVEVQSATPQPRVLDAIAGVSLAVFSIANLAFGELLRSALNVDYLLVCLGAFLLVIALRLPTVIRSASNWWIAGALALIVLPGFLASEVSSYGATKAATFGLIVVLLFLAAGIRDVRYVARVVLRVWVAASLLVAFAVAMFGELSANGRVSVFGMNPVGVARLSALAAAILFVALLRSRRQLLRSVLCLAGISLALYATAVTGSRGPLVSVAVAVASVAVVGALTRSLSIFRAILIIGVGAIGLLFVFTRFADPSMIARLVSGGDSGRSGIYEVASAAAMAHPEGVGWGGFTRVGWQWASTIEDGIYPHNLLLEVWLEGGLIALVGAAVLLALTAAKVVKACRDESGAIPLYLLAVFAFALANAMFSSDVVGNRLLWGVCALIVAWRGPKPSRGPRRGAGPALSLVLEKGHQDG